MKPLLILGLAGILAPWAAADVHRIEEVGVELAVPADWRHDASDDFGYVIRPPSPAHPQQKVRVHNTSHQAATALEASRLAQEKINKGRDEKDWRYQRIIDEKEIRTASGLAGCRSSVEAYLHRYYFQRPDGSFFCVCVYHRNNPAFAGTAEEWILKTLRLLPRSSEQEAR